MLRQEKQRQLAEEDHKRQEEMKQVEVSSYQERSALQGKRLKTWSIVGLVLLLLVGAFTYARSRPGRWDGFAECLTEKGMVMYGAIEWCSYTQKQAAMFGKSFKKLNYQDHTNLPGIKKTPTWVFNGKWLDGVQSFERLAAETGCSYSGESAQPQGVAEGEGNLLS